jgi:hypothetical protein
MDGRLTRTVVAFRDIFTLALGSTGDRQRVADKLSTTLDSLSTGDLDAMLESCALVHFLTVESQWLRRPPLCFAVCRERVALIACAIATNGSLDVCDRLNGILVLRASSKLHFANQFCAVFESAVPFEELLRPLLFHAFTYLVRLYHEAAEVFMPLHDALVSLHAKIADGRLHVSEAIAGTLERVLFKAESEYANAVVRGLTPVQAWTRLRKEFGPGYEPHSPAPRASIKMQPGPHVLEIEQIVENPDPASTATMSSALELWFTRLSVHWRVCQSFLDGNIFPALSLLRPVLEGEDARNALSHDTCDRILTILDEMALRKTPIAYSAFSILVESLKTNLGCLQF